MPELQPKQGAETSSGDKISSSNLFFTNTSSELAHSQVSVDLFIFTIGKGVFKNLQTFADLARFSCGNLFYYPDYEYYQSGLKFTNELYNSLTRSCAWEGVFRVRTSTGFNQIATYGNKLIKQRTADLILCPVIDKDRVIVYELDRELEASDKPERRRLMTEQKHMFIQSALLYSTADGERRIRVHNAAVPLTNQAHLVFDYMDTSALALYYARAAIARSGINQGNFASIQNQLLLSLQNLCRAQAKAAQQACYE
jgi:protein transport protein SEC24